MYYWANKMILMTMILLRIAVNLCIQLDAREAAHRAGPFATTENILVNFTVVKLWDIFVSKIRMTQPEI